MPPIAHVPSRPTNGGHPLAEKCVREHERYVTCVACGSSAIRYWRSKSYAYSSRHHMAPFSIYCCDDCGSGFLNPPPTDELLAEIYKYSGQALSAPVSARAILEREERFPGSTLDAERIVGKAMTALKSSTGNALDVGSGYGFFTKRLVECGFRTTSINPGQYENEVFKEICGHEPLSVYFEDFSTDVEFDIILMSQVLEHMKSPAQSVQRVAELLSEGGVFACAVPNFASFSVKTRGVRDNGCLWIPEHVNYFTVTGLAQLMVRSGLKVVHYEHVTRIPTDALFRRLRIPRTPWLGSVVEIPQRWFASLTDRLGYGLCINVYAVKE